MLLALGLRCAITVLRFCCTAARARTCNKASPGQAEMGNKKSRSTTRGGPQLLKANKGLSGCHDGRVLFIVAIIIPEAEYVFFCLLL